MIYFKNLIYGLFLIGAFGVTLQASSDVQKGQELFNEANCKKCHITNGKFDKMKGKVQNIKNLATWVSNCDNSLQIGWFPEEQEKVTKYLNETYYKLEK
jgi:cytochrome c peroxidase